MNRRSFISTSLKFASGSLAVPFLPQILKKEYNGIRVIRRNVGTFTGRGGAIGWLADENSVVVVDAQFPPSARLFHRNIRNYSSQSIDVVINTHHHADHTAGNFYFNNIAAQIVAHENVPDLQRFVATNQNTLGEQVYADTTFDEEWSLDTGDEIIHAFHYGPAHTAGDAIVWFEKANVIHMGDLIFNRWYPFIDTDGGASILNWIDILEGVVENTELDTIFIFGHGSNNFGITGLQNDVLVMRDYLSALLEFVELSISEGNSLDEIQNRSGFENFPDHISPGSRLSFQANVQAAWNELSNF